MKTRWAVIGFVIGIIVSAALCTVIDMAHETQHKVQLLSSIQYPIKHCLDDIVKTNEDGDGVLAQQKLRLLQKRWDEYINGTAQPEQFSSEVTKLGTAASQPAQ